ncbi:hypothetical protein Tsubulata_009852 [Turnera subulata]|uniref:CNH domain-containing protein n=1 Tax=Turnera subulata TaxID=218843 RepID=A0A9Q0J767_9ROSI|nr:hypothetical protein Tsubulata_009852 [Turnera subulata]
MANPDPSPASSRTVLDPLSTFDLSSISPSPIHSLSLSLSSSSHDQTLFHLGTRSGSLLLLLLQPPSLSLLRTLPLANSPILSLLPLPDLPNLLVLANNSLFLIDSLLSLPHKKLPLPKSLPLISALSKRIVSPESPCTDLSLVSPDSSSSSTRGQHFFHKLGGRSRGRANGIKTESSPETEADGEESNGNSSSSSRSRSKYEFVVVSGKKLVLTELVNGSSLVVVKELVCLDEGIKSVVWINDSIIVGTSKGYSLFSCVSGQGGVLFTLPEDVASLPLMKVLAWKEKKVMLVVDNVGLVVNSEGQPVGGSLVFRRGRPECVGELGPYVVVVKGGKMELCCKKSGRCVQTVAFAVDGVGPCFVANEEGGDGEVVAVATPSKVFCYRKVPSEEQIKDLLRKKNFKEAISLVEELESDGELSKEMLSFVHAQVGFLLLFDLHFEDAVNHFLQSETMQPSEVFPFIMRDPNRWSLLVPRNRYWGLHPPPAPLEDVIDDGLLAIQRAIFLRKAGIDTTVDEEFLSNPPARADLLQVAIKNIIRYLEVSRGKELTVEVKEGVDTLLMYLYRALNNVDDMEKLASSENNCIVEELETLLDDSGHLRTLAFLYASKGVSSKALAIWRILARNYSSGLWKDTAADSNSNVLSGREIAAIEASKILEESSDQDLVLQHLGWVADINSILAVQILTSEKRVDQLSPDKVIAAIDPRKVEILQSYLQWLIEDQDSNDSQLHTLYAVSLAKSAIEILENQSSPQELDDGKVLAGQICGSERTSIFTSSVRERLQIFLQSSDLYDPEEILDLIEGSELWLEKAILYRRLGQETLVLQILALKLEDSEAAEHYCAEIGRPDAYMQLLDMYLDPQNGKEPMFNAAVRLLHNHGEALDPLQVLETLSPDMPLKLASDTILRMLRARIHHHRQGQIVHNLSRALAVDARLARLEERSRLVQINDESLCDSCHARLGTKLFAMYPDDTVVCYKCFRRQGESTSVTGRDFKQDVLIKPGWLVTR